MLDKHEFKHVRVRPGDKVHLKKFDTNWVHRDELKEKGHDLEKEAAKKSLKKIVDELADAQELLYAAASHGVLIILQGMDTSGKDGTVKHVMSGVNPQGCAVYSFKEPSTEESSHNFLWRYSKVVPKRGQICIFNRSYYEEIVAVKVHPVWLKKQHLDVKKNEDIWDERYEDINAFERHLTRSGIMVLKFFLHISKDEQKERLLARLDDPKKHWKFSFGDVEERRYWSDYQKAYEQAITATSTEWAPWHIIPADYKWGARGLVAEVITTAIRSLKLRYPTPDKELKDCMAKAKKQLGKED